MPEPSAPGAVHLVDRRSDAKMHLPDGFLDAKTAIAGGVLAATGLGIALRTVRQCLPPRRVPLLGMASAFVFAAQLINFPVAGGTSGHLIGAVLTAVLLGPAAAVVVMTSVLILQCLLFQDGGLTALGANVFNMAVVAPAVGSIFYALGRRTLGASPRARLAATAFAAWVATVAAAVTCAGELALSGTVKWGVVLPAMTGIHALIGIVEAVITTLIVASVTRLRPDLQLTPETADGKSGVPRFLALQGLLVALGLALFVAPFACGWPDGLQSVAAKLGMRPSESVAPLLASPWPGYRLPGVESSALSATIVGGIGTLGAFGVCWTLARALTRSSVRGGRPPGAEREGLA